MDTQTLTMEYKRQICQKKRYKQGYEIIKIIGLKGTDGRQVRLLQSYEVLWIHFIDAIFT